VITTASRPKTREWVLSLGADEVLDHRQPLKPQLAAAGHREADFIANFNNTDAYWSTMADIIRPQGRIVSIVENEKPLDLNLLKSKSATFVWEFVFTRSMYQTPDMEEQGQSLNRIAELVDSGKLRTTLTNPVSPINAVNLRTTHAQIESGRAIGKLVLTGWN
jgi:NADPH:quinone reductase-like Zn-dependent oxidoreductase